MGEPIVKLEAVSYRYGQRMALDTVSFDVPNASLFALLGPNGSGKSTLFGILTTLLKPFSGRAGVAGFDVVDQRERVRERLGIVFQHPSLDGKLTVLENLRHHGNLYGLSGSDLLARSRRRLEQFDILDRAADRVDTLSGGLKRRVELAKVLLHEPQVLILDEPSTGLDPGARNDLMDALVELRDNDGVTSLITTHLMTEADRCDRIGVLDQGKLIAMDAPESLKQTIGGEVLTLSGPNPSALADRVAKRFNVKADVVRGEVRIEREGGHAFVPELIEAFPGEISSVKVGRPTLEDVFVHLTGRHLRDEAINDGEAS